MIDIIKAILRGIGIKLEDVTIKRVHKDLDNGLVIPTNDWYMLFSYKHYDFTLELNKLNTMSSWMTLIKHHNDDMLSLDRVELANSTPQELYKIIEEFIHR